MNRLPDGCLFPRNMAGNHRDNCEILKQELGEIVKD